MGTSSARLAPTSKGWRAAKAAATRYLAPAGEGAVTAREVVARYQAALGEGEDSQGLATFRFTRKVAQEMGALATQLFSLGLEATLQARGLPFLVGQSVAAVAQGLAGGLAGNGGGLEEAVARTALVEVWGKILGGRPHYFPGNEDRAATLVQDFLAAAFYHRLGSDLGESLEAAAASFSRLKEGTAGIREEIQRAAAATGTPLEYPATPEEWRGLTGWTWVTKVMAGIMKPPNESS